MSIFIQSEILRTSTEFNLANTEDYHSPIGIQPALKKKNGIE